MGWTVTSALGNCLDSITNYSPTSDTAKIIVTLCPGDSVFIDTNYVDTAGVFYKYLLGKQSCDSIIETTVQLSSGGDTTLNFKVCNGDSLLYNGQHYQPGNYSDTLMTSSDCDSIIILNVSVLATNDTLITDSVCNGDTVSIGNQKYFAAGIYTDTLQGITGCDSIITLDLRVTDAAQRNDTLYACMGETVIINGIPRNNPGSYRDTIPMANSCDSILVTELIYYQNKDTSFTRQFCNGDTFSFNGQQIFTAGNYRDTLQAVNGCDSVVSLQADFLQTIQTSDTITLCIGDSILINGQYRSVSGTYINTYTAVNGCDSVERVYLFNYPAASTIQNINGCLGDTLQLGGQQVYSSGIYFDTIAGATPNGCDSILTYQVNFTPSGTRVRNIALCRGQSIVIQGDSYNSDTSFQYTTLGVPCDSLIEVNISTSNVIAGFSMGVSFQLTLPWYSFPMPPQMQITTNGHLVMVILVTT